MGVSKIVAVSGLLFITLAASMEAGGKEAAGQCDGSCTAIMGASSVLQTSVDSLQKVTKEQLEREKKRQDTLANAKAEELLLIIQSLVLEGMSHADAVSLARSYAGDLVALDYASLDLSYAGTHTELFQENVAPLHKIICLQRSGQQDCESEFKEWVNDAIEVFSSIGTSLLQTLTGKEKSTKDVSLSLSKKGRTDTSILAQLKEYNLMDMKYEVMLGESPASAVQIVADAMSQVLAKSDSDLLAYADYDKVGVSQALITSTMGTLCEFTTSSCSGVLSDYVSDVLNLDTDGASGSLLQTALKEGGVRPIVAVAMKALGIREFPEETAEERAAATEVFLQQRFSNE